MPYELRIDLITESESITGIIRKQDTDWYEIDTDNFEDAVNLSRKFITHYPTIQDVGYKLPRSYMQGAVLWPPRTSEKTVKIVRWKV